MKSVLLDRTLSHTVSFRLNTREDFYHVSPGRAESEGDLGSQELGMPPSPSLSSLQFGDKSSNTV